MYCMMEPFLRTSYKLISRVKLKHICVLTVALILLDFFGAFTHMFEIVYNDEKFRYPYDVDLKDLLKAYRKHEKPKVQPMNEYNYSYLNELTEKCKEPEYPSLRLVFIIKSALGNFDRRQAIRNSWGFEKRFFDVPMRTVFVLGVGERHHNLDGLEQERETRLKLEMKKYHDIVRAEFHDTYYNNTIKTMIGIKWAIKHCLNSKFYMFVDDDIYVSVKNVLRFIRNPVYYPDYLREPRRFDAHKREVNQSEAPTLLDSKRIVNPTAQEQIHSELETAPTILNKTLTAINNISIEGKQVEENYNKTNKTASELEKSRSRRQVFDFQLPDDVKLFTGYVFVSSPHRHKSSKWYVSLKEYPYHLWPPYVTAGAYILSKEALRDLYYTSLYTKHFKFDDIYLGIVAKKAGLEPFHCEEFHFYKKDYTKYNYKYVITSHGYGDPNELLHVWNEQKSLGNA